MLLPRACVGLFRCGCFAGFPFHDFESVNSNKYLSHGNLEKAKMAGANVSQLMQQSVGRGYSSGWMAPVWLASSFSNHSISEVVALMNKRIAQYIGSTTSFLWE